ARGARGQRPRAGALPEVRLRAGRAAAGLLPAGERGRAGDAGVGDRPALRTGRRRNLMTDKTSLPVVLGFETSCDETGVGIVRGTELLADAVATSVDEHARFGGVVPEVASRAHLEAMVPTVHRALDTAGMT